MLDLSCPQHTHTHYYLDEESGREFIIPESFVQRVKDELISLYRRIPPETEDDVENATD